MKNLNRNTLVRDFFGAAFCLFMAFALLMMYSGCSEDNSPINGAHGGAAEEQGFALVGLASDVYPKSFPLEKLGPDFLNNDKYQYNNKRLKASVGAVVFVYELDSLTLDTTGRFLVDTVDNDEGRFTFKEMNFNSPYVFVDVRDSCIGAECVDLYTMGFSPGLSDMGTKFPLPLSAIIDVRKYQNISVNSLSDMKVPLVKKYFAEGMPFDSACKRAEQDVLDSFGVYEDLGEFESLESANGELSYVLRMMPFVRSQMFLQGGFLPISMEYYDILPAAISALGEKAEQVYANTVKLINYEIGSFTRNMGIGRCTESRENETQRILGGANDATVVCHSNKWVPGWKKIEYTNGTMVDNRDGKTYKTVTYNWGDVTQTWMAENLNYADTTSSNADSALKNNLLGGTKCWEGDSTCEIFGRYYTWRAAMNLGWSDINLTSIAKNEEYDVAQNRYIEFYDTVVVEDRCKTYKYNELDFYEEVLESGVNAVVYCFEESPTGECAVLDTARNLYEYCEGKYGRGILDISQVVPESKPVLYQGVCPDGWRLPNKNDWAILQENIHAQGASLTDIYGSGFGYKDVMTVSFVDAEVPKLLVTNREYNLSARFIAVPERIANGLYSNFFNWMAYSRYQLEIRSETYIASLDYTDYSFGDVEFGLFNHEAPVRCIKN